jgi:hypothetical protein
MTGAGGVLASLCPQIRNFCLRHLQPVRHAHLAVHRRRSGEMLLGLLALVRAAVELARPRWQWVLRGRMPMFAAEAGASR